MVVKGFTGDSNLREYDFKSCCSLCGSLPSQHTLLIRTHRAFAGYPIRVVICRGCGFVFLSPRADPSVYDNYYQSENYENINNKPFSYRIEKEIDLAEEIFDFCSDFVKDFLSPIRILDIGAGFGSLLQVFCKKLNGQGMAIELSKQAITYMVSHFDFRIQEMNLESLELPEDTFNFVIASAILEHLNHPYTILMEINRSLRLGGYLFIRVPDTSFLRFNLLKRQTLSRVFKFVHINYFTTTTLVSMVEMAGFDVVRVLQHHPRKNASQGEIWMLAKTTKSEGREIQKERWFRVAFRIWFFSFFAIAISFLIYLTNHILKNMRDLKRSI